ncbi:hypothetical protein WN944_022742 [Citrus x changshan-huyou]|uniref:Uncharacterized protein n=1 Tax=Citrus x changshan-huyou TaxID=2935761 RepID=A0AAP0N3E2_9ROSI
MRFLHLLRLWVGSLQHSHFIVLWFTYSPIEGILSFERRPGSSTSTGGLTFLSQISAGASQSAMLPTSSAGCLYAITNDSLLSGSVFASVPIVVVSSKSKLKSKSNSFSSSLSSPSSWMDSPSSPLSPPQRKGCFLCSPKSASKKKSKKSLILGKDAAEGNKEQEKVSGDWRGREDCDNGVGPLQLQIPDFLQLDMIFSNQGDNGSALHMRRASVWCQGAIVLYDSIWNSNQGLIETRVPGVESIS